MLSSTITILDIVLAFAVAAGVARLLHALIQRSLHRVEVVSVENRTALQNRAAQLGRMLTALAFGAAAIVAVALLMAHFGVTDRPLSPRRLSDWMMTKGVTIVLIVAGAMVVVRAAHLAIEHLQHRLGHRHATTDLEWQRRASTLTGILTRLVTVTVSFVAVLMLLQQLDLDVVPVLTGAGIAGLAIGFGAQNLVRDVISGFFLILEDQVRVGDSARINGVSGSVEQISLRTIVLRDVEGAVQVFPNGTITALANLSKHFAFAVVDVRVSYREDINRVLQTLHDLGHQMRADPEWNPYLLAPLEIGGVESLTERFAVVRMRFKTPPLRQGAVANELRRRIMIVFRERRIRPIGHIDG